MEVTNCIDINGVELNEIQFIDDGTVVGIIENNGSQITTKLSYDCCTAQGYIFDPTNAKCYWAETCLTGGTYNIVLDPQGNTGAFFQVDENEQNYCHLEVSFKFLLKFDCNEIKDSLLNILETLKLQLSIEKVIYDETLPLPNNLEEVVIADLFNVSDIHDFLSGNTNTGILLDGDCNTVVAQFVKDLEPNTEVINDFSLNSDWVHVTMIIDDPEVLETIYNERLKISIIGNSLKNYSIIIDDIQMNRVCDEPIQPTFFEECPTFELKRVIDNKKSWVTNEDIELREFDLERRETTYSINHERLSINTKEIDLAINPSQAIENDVVSFVNENSCLLAPSTGCTSGSTTHECVDLRPLITTEIVDNNDLINQLIDVKNRKTISTYPTLELIYHRYLNSLEHCGLNSNALNNESINSFVDLIGTYWSDLIEQVVPATTIWGSSLTNTDSSFGGNTNKFVYKRGSTHFCHSIDYPVPSPVNGDISLNVVLEDITDINDINITSCSPITIRQSNSGSEFISTINVLGDGEGPITGDTISITEMIVDDCDKFERCSD